MLVGVKAVFLMSMLCLVAYLIGSAIRFNIHYLEPRIRNGSLGGMTLTCERLSDWALAFAYIVTVAYYLNLFGAFLLKGAGLVNPMMARSVTTAILVFIAYFGYHRGLDLLERMEEAAVGIKLAIIAGLLAGLAWNNTSMLIHGDWHLPENNPPFDMLQFYIALGLIITVQGFETSRYLGEKYSAELRIRTMRYSQLIASAIYISFIALATVYFGQQLPDSGRETAIIDLSRNLGVLMPSLLILAALASQFSAGVADTSGGGGLLADLSHKRIRPGLGYVIICGLAILITWSANIFEIISYASKAFAVYYMLQCAAALTLAIQEPGISHRTYRVILFSLLVVLCICIVIFGIPAE
jgi:hypothetical protein